MIVFRMRDWPAIGLASCFLGLVVTPYVYIAIGAPFQFPLAFSLIMLPPLVLCSGFLFWRFLSKPRPHSKPIVLLLMEGASLAVVATFLFFVSHFGLFTQLERIGMFCMFFVSASACSLPVVTMRDTTLEQRLARVPKRWALALLAIILVLSGGYAIVWLLMPPQFPH